MIKKIIGKNYAIIKEIKQDRNENGFMSGETKPVMKEFGLPMKMYISSTGYFHVVEGSFRRSLFKYDVVEGKTMYYSSYA